MMTGLTFPSGTQKPLVARNQRASSPNLLLQTLRLLAPDSFPRILGAAGRFAPRVPTTLTKGV